MRYRYRMIYSFHYPNWMTTICYNLHSIYNPFWMLYNSETPSSLVKSSDKRRLLAFRAGVLGHLGQHIQRRIVIPSWARVHRLDAMGAALALRPRYNLKFEHFVFLHISNVKSHGFEHLLRIIVNDQSASAHAFPD